MKEFFILNKFINSIIRSLLLIFLLICIKSGKAQDTLVNRFSLNASFTFKEGKLNQTIFSLDGNYTLTAKYYKTELFANYKYIKTNGKVGENDFLGRILVSILPDKKIFPVIGYIYNVSELYQIQRRHIPGLGIGGKLLENRLNNLNLYIWAAYDHTQFKNISGYNTFRINTFLVGNHKLFKDKLDLEYVIYYLQSLEAISNYIWRIEPTLSVNLTKNFALTLNLEIHYENLIDPSNTNRNSMVSVGFKYKNK